MRSDVVVIVAAVAVFAALFSFTLTSDGCEGATNVDSSLTNEYSDYDYIISEGSRGLVNITYKVPYKPTSSELNNPDFVLPEYDWSVRTINSGSDLQVTRLGSVSGALNVVMVGGSLGTVTLIQTDTVSTKDPVDVVFSMYGGSISELKVLTVPSSLKPSIKNSYTLMFTPLGGISLNLQKGTIGVVNPTEDMVASDSISISVGDGMSIDRLYPSGTNGRYNSVNLGIYGADVGYVTNLKAVVGDLTYDIRSGRVDYLCIGSNTEHGTNQSLTNMNTFYANGDVKAVIDSTVATKMVIIGGGILSTPGILWNGDSALTQYAKNFLVDAPGIALYPDSCFSTPNRAVGTAYQLSNYTLDSTTRTKLISSEFYLSGSRLPVYGEGGVWPSATSPTIPTGYSMWTNCDVVIPSGSSMKVSPGASLSVAEHMTVIGTLEIGGQVINNGIIEKREGGNLKGLDPVGDGYVAYCISVEAADGKIDVMPSDDDTVVLRTDGTVYISHISVRMGYSDSEVIINAPDGMYIGGNWFLISLRTDESGDHVRLDIMGIDPVVLESLSVTVTVSPPGNPSDYYVYRETDGSDTSMEIIDVSVDRITFEAQGTGTYRLSTTAPDGTELAEESYLKINIILAVAIALVGSVIVYILLRKD